MVLIPGNDPEGATPIEDYSSLKLNHITTRKELYDAEFANITLGSSYFLLKPPALSRLFTRKELYNIHKLMLANVWEWAGQKRKSNKSVGVDKYQIDIELEKLIKNYLGWETFGLDAIEISARIHHGLVYIHPFENGNGRWARLVTNLYLREKLNKIIKWPEEELFIETTFRKHYVSALRTADQGCFADLIKIQQDYLSAIFIE